MRPPIRFRAVLPVAVALLLVASCGTSVPENTVDSLRGDTTVETTTTAPDDPTTTVDADPTTTIDDDPPVTPTGDEFCDEMAKFVEVSEEADDDFGVDGMIDDISDADLAKMKEGFARIDETFSAAADAAPAEITDDMALMASLYADLNDKISSAESAEDLFSAIFSLTMGDFDEDELDTAAENISTYVEDECGIDLEMD